MPLKGVMLMKQAGMAERRLRQPHGKRLHCSALEPLRALHPGRHSHQCTSPAPAQG